ncbi:MAG: TolC family protein [Pseudomonadales bacterium]
MPKRSTLLRCLTVLGLALGMSAAANSGAAPSAAAKGARVLTAEAVLAASARAVPTILEARSQREAVVARRLAAEGGFDRTLSQGTRQWVLGDYDGFDADLKLTQPLATLGGDLTAAYRISDGSFPRYETERQTLGGGELSLGLTIPLLQDRTLDDRRFARRDATLAIAEADASLFQTQLDVQHDALIAYWRWVAAGRKLTIFEKLLAIAEERDRAFRAQSAVGDIAEIAVVENQQNLLKRRQLARRAARDFTLAATDLSFFLRDDKGAMQPVEAAALPPAFPPIEGTEAKLPPARLAAIIEATPTLQALAQKAQRLRLKRNLAQNDLRPELDFSLKLAKDLGQGPRTLNGNDVITGFEFSLPLQRRKARGAQEEAEAALQAVTFRQARETDGLRLAILRLQETVAAAADFAALADQEADAAETLEAAEWVKFREGASSFFILNAREENTADARVRALDAQLAFQQAVADFALVTADRGRLGLTSPAPPEAP